MQATAKPVATKRQVHQTPSLLGARRFPKAAEKLWPDRSVPIRFLGTAPSLSRLQEVICKVMITATSTYHNSKLQQQRSQL